MVFKIICSYCGKDMGTKEAPGNSVLKSLEQKGFSNISHSICSECFRKQMEILDAKGEEDLKNETLNQDNSGLPF